jgi:hypothetical protein
MEELAVGGANLSRRRLISWTKPPVCLAWFFRNIVRSLKIVKVYLRSVTPTTDSTDQQFIAMYKNLHAISKPEIAL